MGYDEICVVLLGLCFGLCAVIVINELLHRRERKDLYDRLMSRDIETYKRASEHAEHERVESAHRRVIDNWRRPYRGEGRKA